MRRSTQMISFIETSMNAAKPKNGNRTEYRVKEARRNGNVLERLVLDVLPNGKRYWRVHYDVRRSGIRLRRKAKIGDATTPLSIVRERWRLYTDSIEVGGDPVAEEQERQRQKELDRSREYTFADLADAYMTRYAQLQKRSWKDDQRKLNRHILPALASLPVEKIAKRDIIQVIDAVAQSGATVQADRVKALISSIFNWGRDEDLCEHNPADRIRKRSETRRRERPLTEEEIHLIWEYCDEEPEFTAERQARTVIKLALLTGQRRWQISGAAPLELELIGKRPIWFIPHIRSKNKEPHAVPLSPMAVKLFKEAMKFIVDEDIFVFPSAVKSGVPLHADTVSDEFAKACKKLKIECVDLHGVRHTVGTELAKLGVSKEIRSRILSHKSDTANVTDRYDHYDYDAPKRKALERWSRRLREIVDGAEPKSNVVEMRRN